MNENPKPAILLVGSDATLSYLFGRFAEQSGYQLTGNTETIRAEEIETIKPAVILFLSTDVLAKNQALVAELASHESPILVCSSATDEAQARELGADYCLLHPLTYNDFQTALEAVSTPKQV
jgi:CheY-like chemotaxis protein